MSKQNAQLSAVKDRVTERDSCGGLERDGARKGKEFLREDFLRFTSATY